MNTDLSTELDDDLRALEQQLSSLIPSAMPEDMISRMEQAMDSWMDVDMHPLEQELADMAPTAMPDAMQERLSSAMGNWHRYVPEDEKVVSISNSKSIKRGRKSGGMLAAAAAVAMLGAAAALVLPHFDRPSNQTVDTSVIPQRDVPATMIDPATMMDVDNSSNDAWIMPDSLSTNVVHTSDRGIMLNHENRPHRCIRVDYVDRIKAIDAQGREIEIKRPGVKIMLLPVEEN
ncbi:MAG: hypothetical protein ACPG32_05430 [Akkermansiaceae bacterium]